MIRAVIVDFDDTLCLTEQACFNLENDVLRQMGRPAQNRAFHKNSFGQPLFEVITKRSPGVNVEEFRRRIVTTQVQWVKEGRIDAITPDNLQTLDRLLEAGKQLFVLTSRSHGEVMHMLASGHELATRITELYYRDIMRWHKPDPRAFDELLTKHGLTPAESLYVGDSPSDAQAAKGAQLHFVASLEAGIRTRQDFAPFAVDAFIHCFSDLPAVVNLLDQKLK